MPAYTYSNTDKVCPLVVLVNSLNATQSFTYKSNVSPTLSSVSPIKGAQYGFNYFFIIF